MVKNNPVKQLLKRSVQHIAALAGPHRFRQRSPQLLVLMYHRILPVSDRRLQFEEPGMYVSPDNFDMHLEILGDYFQFIHLSEWLQRKKEHLPLPDRACAITFDDGWADNYEFAFPILQKQQVPASIYLVSDLIGTSAQFWPERLARTINAISSQQADAWLQPELNWLRESNTAFSFTESLPTTEQLSEIIAHIKIFPDEEIHKRLDDINQQLQLEAIQDSPPSLLNWSQVKEMQSSGLVEIGSHTRYHTRLDKHTRPEVLHDAIIGSKNHIEQNTGITPKTFCFPNGDFSQAALELVRKNYQGSVTTRQGWNSGNSDSHLLQRIGVHNDIAYDRTSFLANASGWL